MTSQLKTLRLVRKMLPPATKVIIDRKVKSRRRRQKHVEQYLTPSWINTL